MTINVSIVSGQPAPDELPDVRVRCIESGPEHQLDLPFRDLYRRCGVPNATALDLLMVASACYIVDKTVPRTGAVDRWTRDLNVQVPVSDPERWTLVSAGLAEALTFLTGDVWRVSFTGVDGALFELPPAAANNPAVEIPPADAVCLFSGGLDSLAGAIDMLADAGAGKVLLVGHYDSHGPRKVQRELFQTLSRVSPDRLDILQVRVAHRPAKAAEESLRSRSLVFIALGLYAAQAFGSDTPLWMFENGLIALNVPLTPSRKGSCSSRTMHPYYLSRIKHVLTELGVRNPIRNPYTFKTKGESLAECRNRELLAELAHTSVSCSHGSRRQHWVRKGARNCGYCIPCIFRRAALHKIGLDDGAQYGLNILEGELSIADQLESADDLRAVVDFLRIPLTPTAMRKKLIATARFDDLDAYANMACRGFAEVREWLAHAAGTARARTASAVMKHA